MKMDEFMNPPDTTYFDNAKKDIIDNIDDIVCKLIEGNTVTIYPPSKKCIKVTYHKSKRLI